MLFALLGIIQAQQLLPGIVTQLTCTTTNQSITLTRQSMLNQISLVLESNETSSISAIVVDSKKQNEEIQLGLPNDLSSLAEGNLTLWYQCEIDSNVIVYYYDAQVAYEGQKFINSNTTDVAYFMFPVCHPDKNIQIFTNGTVTVSFSEGYPTKNTTINASNTQIVVPYSNRTYSSYLYIQLNGTNASLTVYQQNVSEIQSVNGRKYQVNISSLQFCYQQFVIPSNLKAKQLVVSGSGASNYVTYGRIYYKDKLNLSELPTELKNTAQNYKQLVLNDSTPNGAFSIRPYKKDYFLPLEHNPSQFSDNELVLYVLNETELMSVGTDNAVNINISEDISRVFLVDYKPVSDFQYNNATQEKTQRKYRYFIAQATSEQDISNLTLNFCPQGLDQCTTHENVSTVESMNSVQILYRALENDTSAYEDLVGLSLKRSSTGSVPNGTAKLEAYNMYKLSPRVAYKYKGKQTKYGVVDLVSDNQLLVQVIKPMGQEVIVSISQKYFFPTTPSDNLQDDTFQTKTCTQQMLTNMKCQLTFSNLNTSEVYIKFESTDSFIVTVGKGADLATLMYLDEETKGKLIMFNSYDSLVPLQYILEASQLPRHDQVGADLLFIAELDTATVKTLLKKDVDIQMYFGFNQNPSKHSDSFVLSMRDWVQATSKQNDLETIYSRGHIQIPLKGNADIYVSVVCKGDCTEGDPQAANFKIYPTVVYEVAERGQIQNQSFYFQSSEKPISGTFMTLDEQSAYIKFYKPRFHFGKLHGQAGNKDEYLLQKISGKLEFASFIRKTTSVSEQQIQAENLLLQEKRSPRSNAIDCASLNYIVTLCIGVYPRDDDMASLPSSCKMLHSDLSLNDQFISLSLDSSQFNVSSGNVYFRIDPDLDSFNDNPGLIKYCQVPIDLYINDQLLNFNEQYKQVMFGGSNQDVHLAVDFPAYSGQGANDTTPGDYYIIQLETEKQVILCITDDVNTPYGSNCQQSEISNNSVKKYYFKNFRNFNPSGQLLPHTRVYITLSDACVDCKYMEPYMVGIVLLPQTSVSYTDPQYFTFKSTEYYGSPEYMSFAINISDLDYKGQDATLIVTPDCFTQECKDDPPPELQYHNLITYVSFSQSLPEVSSGKTVVLDNAGPQTISLQDLSSQTQESAKQSTLYVHIKYRYAETLQLTGESSPITFSMRLQPDFGVSNMLQYQATRHINQSAGDAIQYFSSALYYEPSEIVVFPCKGRIGLALSRFSLPNPTKNGTTEQITTGEWGMPLIWRVYDVEESAKTMYMGVFDANAYNESSNTIQNSNALEYDLFVGSSATLNVPGGSGQIEVVSFSDSGDGKVRVRFAPASAPNQATPVSQVNYYLYAVPYQGSLNQSTDYSPYTACGVKAIGYSVYNNSIGLPNIEVNQSQVEKYGYIEVESNLPLWGGAQSVSRLRRAFKVWKSSIGGLRAPEKTVLYVTVLAGQVSYGGELVEASAISQAVLLTATLVAVLIVIAAVVILFWIAFLRVRRAKRQGYRPVVA